MLNLPCIEDHGWDSDGGTVWMKECLPKEYDDLMIAAETAHVDDDDNDDEDDEDDDDVEDVDIDVVDVDF